MVPIVLLIAVSLLTSIEESSPETIFVQTGGDVFLKVNKPVVLEEQSEFKWRFNDTDNVVRVFSDKKKKIIDRYQKRAEIFVQNYSLLLKNMQHIDSGLYSAIISGDKEQSLTTHMIIIQDPVSPVKLTVSPELSSSSDSCNFTVTCSTQDSHHINSTFTCDTKTCSQEGGERSKDTASGASFHVYLSNVSVICNHSNKVSWKKDIKEIQHLCLSDPVPNKAIAIATGTTAAVAVVGLAVFLFMKCRRKTCENTIYEVPQDINPVRTPLTEDASGLSPASTYALVQFHTGPAESTKKNTNPETIYAQVVKPNPRSPPPQPTPRAEKH